MDANKILNLLHYIPLMCDEEGAMTIYLCKKLENTI